MIAVNAEVAAALTAFPVTRLTHFTPALNLPNIIADGQLRSVKDLKADVRACYKPTDLKRLDGYPDKICCSLQYPNGFYFDVARAKIANYPDWVCLLLDVQIAASEGTLFCPRNAAAADDTTAGVAGLLACYAPTVLGQGGITRRRGTTHDPASPTDVQAEVLLTAPVPLSSVNAIVFPTEAAAQEEYGRLERFGLLPPNTVGWIVSAGMFHKWAITAAARSSNYFAETAWSPMRAPAATS